MKPKEQKIYRDNQNIENLLNSTNSLDELIMTWIKANNHNIVNISNGFDDQHNFVYVCVELMSNKSNSIQIAEFYYDLEEAKNYYSEFPLADTLLDDDELEAFEESNEILFNETLQCPTGDLKQAVPIMMMNAMCEGRHCCLSSLNESSYKDLEMEEDFNIIENKGNIFFCNIAALNPNKREVTYLDYYFVRG